MINTLILINITYNININIIEFDNSKSNFAKKLDKNYLLLFSLNHFIKIII
jgi:hypothetical protein